MQGYKELKKVIQKANPEIMELNLGCKFGINPDILTGVIINSEDVEDVKYIDDYNNYIGSLHVADEGLYILGRPIRLADVLLAIGTEEIEPNHYAVLQSWNLKYDNLDNQPKETKQFLIDLFVK